MAQSISVVATHNELPLSLVFGFLAEHDIADEGVYPIDIMENCENGCFCKKIPETILAGESMYDLFAVLTEDSGLADNFKADGFNDSFIYIKNGVKVISPRPNKKLEEEKFVLVSFPVYYETIDKPLLLKKKNGLIKIV